MQSDRIDEVRAELMSELDWPVTTGEVLGAAETLDEPTVLEAARRLPDDGTWVEIDDLWADLRPAIDAVLDDAP